MILREFCAYYSNGYAISFCLPCVRGDSPQFGEMSRSDRGDGLRYGGGAACRLGGVVKQSDNYITIPQSASLTAPFTQGSPYPLSPLRHCRRPAHHGNGQQSCFARLTDSRVQKTAHRTDSVRPAHRGNGRQCRRYAVGNYHLI